MVHKSHRKHDAAIRTDEIKVENPNFIENWLPWNYETKTIRTREVKMLTFLTLVNTELSCSHNISDKVLNSIKITAMTHILPFLLENINY